MRHRQLVNEAPAEDGLGPPCACHPPSLLRMSRLLSCQPISLRASPPHLPHGTPALAPIRTSTSAPPFEHPAIWFTASRRNGLRLRPPVISIRQYREWPNHPSISPCPGKTAHSGFCQRLIFSPFPKILGPHFENAPFARWQASSR